MPVRRGPRGPGLPYSHGLGGDAAVVDTTPVSTDPATLPQVILEWMPNASPTAADGTWVDITQYLSSGSCGRGRQVEFDQFSAGTMTVTLEAFSRLFDPEYTSGTYYGKLTPMRQIRLRFKWNGTVYPAWRGYVQSWGSTVEQDKKYVTTITCVDGFARLEQIALPSSAWALEVQKDNPTLWFRLGETDTARATDSSPNGNYGIYSDVTQGTTGLVVNDSDGAITVASGADQRVYIQNPSLITDYPFTVSAVFQTTYTSTSGNPLIFYGHAQTVSSSAKMYLALQASAAPAAIGFVIDASGNYRSIGTDTVVSDGQTHHVMWVAVTSGNFAIYLDGVLQTSAAVTSGTGTPSYFGTAVGGYTIGNTTDVQFAFTNGFGGIIDEICVWNGAALGADRAAAHSLAAKTGWAGDDTGTRVSRFLDRINWPTDLRDIATGISVLGAASWSEGSSALSVLQAWADTELGAFFMGKDGKLVWGSRHYPFLNTNATRSRLSFGDTGSTAQVLVEDDGLEPVRDATLIRNPVIASRTNGISVTVRDDNLADTVYGPRSWSSPTSEDQKDSAIRDRALWLLGRFKNETVRFDKIAPLMRPQPVYWDQVLGLELGDRVTVLRTPLGTGNQINSDQIIEQIAWQFTPYDLSPTFRSSPVDPNVGSYMILDDAVYGLLDTGLLAY